VPRNDKPNLTINVGSLREATQSIIS
jgi:hypothetical protein